MDINLQKVHTRSWERSQSIQNKVAHLTVETGHGCGSAQTVVTAS